MNYPAFSLSGKAALATSAHFCTVEPAERVIEESVAWKGALDILVNNAGIISRRRCVRTKSVTPQFSRGVPPAAGEEPRDIGGASVFLASNAAVYAHGAVPPVGGRRARATGRATGGSSIIKLMRIRLLTEEAMLPSGMGPPYSKPRRLAGDAHADARQERFLEIIS
ncbi:MAG: hypothetical protein J0H41_09440 [Rhizobiales bacterium]|nr:hypothetical protein [Hyphomicrobiales bacterium]